MKDVKSKAKEIGSNVIKFGAATAGLAVASLGMKQIPAIASLPDMANKVIPGISSMVVAALITGATSSPELRAAALGMGLAGFTDLVNKTVGDKLPASFKLPQLSGTGYVQNYGDYPVNYFTRKVNGVNGFIGNPLQLGDANRFALGAANPLTV